MNILVQQSTGGWGLLAAIDNGDGTVSLSTTSDTPNASLTFNQPNGEFIKVATVRAAGVDTLAVAGPAQTAENWMLSYVGLLAAFGPLPSVVVTTTNPVYPLSNADVGARIRVTAAAGFIDAYGLTRNEGFVLLDVVGACTLACGYTGETWRGTVTNKLALVAGTYLIHRSQGDFVCTQIPAFTAASVAAWPIPVAIWGWFGQSYAERTDDSGNRGIDVARRDMGLATYVQMIQNMPTGASRVANGGGAPGGFMWDLPGAGTPSTVYATSLAAAAAGDIAFPTGSGYPAMSDVWWMHGANEFTGFAAAGPVTPAILTTAYRAVATQWRTDRADPAVRIWILPFCGQMTPETNEGAPYAQRRAQLDACVGSAVNLRGPDYYDLPLPDGIHQSWAGMAKIGQRIACRHARIVSATNVYLGPTIVDLDGLGRGVQRIGPGHFRVHMDRFGGLPATGLNVAPIDQVEDPLGFGLHASSDFFSDAIFPVRFVWGTDSGYTSLDLFTAEDIATPWLAYPYGSMPTASYEQSRIVGALDRTYDRWWPLATFHPTV